MNKIYTYAIPIAKNGRIIDARNAYTYDIIAEVEVYDGMTDEELEATKREIGIPDNAVVVRSRLV